MKAAVEAGRICAIAGQGQRDLQRCADTYTGLYAGSQFDRALFSTLALAGAFTATWLDASELRVANRVGLWVFGLDWRVDHEARSLAEVRAIAHGCLDVADGATANPAEPLLWFLGDLRDEIAAASALPEWRSVWRDELRRLLEASEREWVWKSDRDRGKPGPALDDYLDNADNFGSTFVNISHWLATGELSKVEDAAEMVAASFPVQQALRLLNDLATYERDLDWGDLNALLLGVSRDEVAARVAELVKDCGEVVEQLRSRRPRIATYLERQLDFCIGFYGITDFWGRL